MPRRHRIERLLLGLVMLAGSLAAGPPAGPVPPAAEPVPAPQWVGGTDARGKAQLIWIRTPSFAAVRVYRRDEGSTEPFKRVAETGENAWLDDTVQLGKTYRYRLAGVGRDGREGRPSSELVVRIGVARLRSPVAPEWEGYLPVGEGAGLKWSAREGEDVIAWNIYRKTPPDTEYRLIGSSRGTSYHDTPLETDRLYVYALTALDSNFRETPFSQELPVKLAKPQPPEQQKVVDTWRVRRTKPVALVPGGKDLPFERPADVAVGPVTGSVYVADSGRNLVFVFTPQGVFQRTIGAAPGTEGAFRNVLGLGVDRDENLFVVDAGAAAVHVIPLRGRPLRRADPPAKAGVPTGLIDAAVGPDGRVYVVDNYNNQVTILGRESAPVFGRAGAKPGEFSAPTFCAVDGAGSVYVSDCLNGRVQVFAGNGNFIRAFGRPERGPGGFGRPKGVAVSAAGEVYVADSWLNTVQVFDPEGRFVAVLADENGKPLDLGSPNGVALGAGNRVYVAERLSARLQIRELMDVP